MRKGRILFNDNWQFTLTEPDSKKSAVKDAVWYDVELPHDWLIGDTANLYKSGCGWYKKSFKIEKEELDDSFILCFDGVYMDTTVYVNGKEAGVWKYGYTSFHFDISELLKSGRNEILVRVNHKSPNTRWYSGAGIYRSVYLRHTSKQYITEDGVYIYTKCNYHINDNNPGRWRVTVETELNDEINGSVMHIITDPDGNEVYTSNKRICGISDKTSYFTDTPVLWDVEEPKLYNITTILYAEDGTMLDKVENRFGFRMIDFDSNTGVSLNCRRIKLNGVCLHHDSGALGSAVNYDATLRQLTILKEMGVNAVRTSHNPPSREFMEICDEIGLLVVSEFLDMWEIPKNEFDYARYFGDWYKEDVKSWVRRDRNHPSIIMWSIGNEIPDTHKSERGLEVAKMLCEEVIKHDPAKNGEATIGSNFMPWKNAQKVADFLKLAGYNYAERLYNEHHEAHPDWVIYGSETASTVRSRGIYHFPADTALLTHDDLQCSDLLNSVVNWGSSPKYSFTKDRDAKFSMGQFVWTGFDYIGEPTPYSTKNSYFGIVDTAGIPKDVYYLYKSFWNKDAEPYIHILPYWDYNEGQLIDILAYTNLPVLELCYDGKAYERQIIDTENSDKLYGEWRIPYDKSKTVTVKGYMNIEDKKAVCESSICAFGEASSLCLAADKTVADADGRAMFFIDVSAADDNGNAVRNANNRVKITVKGPARLVGLDNGNSTDYDSYKGDNRRLFSGRMTAMLMTTLDAGEITVTAEAEGLAPATITLTSAPCDTPEGISVVTENTFPAVTREYSNEIYVRKIELTDTNSRELNENCTTRRVAVKIYPENATYTDIGFKCCSDNGVEINFAEVTDYDGKELTITAKGDGKFRLRAFANNGKDFPEIISELEYSITGLGDATKNPYKFNAACLSDFSNCPLNTIERGALGGFNGRTVIGYSAVDFGSGADRVIISVGNCGGGEDFPVELYIGDADKGGRYIGTFGIAFNGGWDRAHPQEFALPETIKGIQDISFVIDRNCIYGGFEFIKCQRAYKLNFAGDTDNVYGDDFNVNGRYIEDIGNNVVIEFSDMDFDKGTQRIEITAKTPLDFCTVQIRATDKNGVQVTRLVEFPNATDYTTVAFDIEELKGVYDISFVFLPGTKFSMESFKFIEK